MRDTLTRYFAGSRNRKPWPELFFDNGWESSLTEAGAGEYKDVLNLMRLAPSASNKQPWRIVKSSSDNEFHFYVRHAGQAITGIFGFDMQKIDLGIAMYHFEAAAREKGLNGHWVQEKPAVKIPAGQENLLEYLFSWKVE